MRRPQASFEAQPRSARLLAPRWASAPTNIHEKSTDLEGGQSRPPLQRSMKNHAGQAKNHRVFHFMPGRADVGIGPYNRPHKAPDLEGGQSRPPLQRGLKTRRVRRKLLRLPFCVVGVDAHIDPFRRQNGNTPVGADERYCTEFRFHTVGASAPTKGIKNKARPAEIAASHVLRRRGRCPHRPIPPPKRKHPCGGAEGRYCTGFRFRTVGADRVVRPYK